MVNEYMQYLEDRILDFSIGTQILKEDTKKKISLNEQYLLKGGLTTIFSLLPFQERNVSFSNSIPRKKTVYYNLEFTNMGTENKIFAGLGFLSTAGLYYGVGLNYTGIDTLLSLHLIVQTPFTFQYILNNEPKIY